MPPRLFRACALAAACLLVLAATRAATACTGIRLKAKDGAVVYARTMEFGAPLPPVITAVPKGVELVGLAPGGAEGLRWTARYAAVGMGTEAYDVMADGLNEKGLGAGLFYHPGYAKYAEADPNQRERSISVLQLATYLLTTCATVDDARQAMKSVVVAPTEIAEFGGPPPLHAVVHDAAGNCIVIEFLEGETRIFDNPLGVITNAPTFDWHVVNLRNYVNLTPTNKTGIALDDLKLGPFGEGSGMPGLPGDFTPPSRFVRAVAFTRSAHPVEDAGAAVNQAFHILNNFDIVPGYVRSAPSGHAAHEADDVTQWTTASDLANRRFYYRTYEDPRIRFVDLTRLKLGDQPLRRPLNDRGPTFVDETTD